MKFVKIVNVSILVNCLKLVDLTLNASVPVITSIVNVQQVLLEMQQQNVFEVIT